MQKRDFIKKATLGAIALNLKPTSWITVPEDIPIIDTHLHLWDRSVMDYPWLSGVLDRDFLVDDYRQATKGASIQKMVFVECARKPEQYLTEVQWVEQRSKEDSRIKGRTYEKEMEELCGHSIVKSVRKGVNEELLQSKKFLEGVSMMQGQGLNYDLNIQPGLMKSSQSFIKRYPDMPFILNHIANPNISSGEHWESWRKQIKELAELENVNCKISGMITKADPSSWKVADLSPYFEEVMEAFGADRVVYGGDWPVVLRAGAYMDWMEAFLALSSALSKTEKEKLYYGNAERIYRI